MNSSIYFQLALFLTVLFIFAFPLGSYIASVMSDEDSKIKRVFGPVERFIYRICGVDHNVEMGWKSYSFAVILFSLVGVLFVYAMQRLQAGLPLNPQAMAAISPDSSFNTAVSFVTNTNWQGYTGEAAMSYLTQMLALAVQNFFSAATGLAVVIAMIRGFSRHSAQTIGNFWVDLTRSTLYILLPLALIIAVIFMSQGVIQNFDNYKTVNLSQELTYTQPKVDASGAPILDKAGQPVTETLTTKTQTLPMGPVASQESIKMVGTNGGGFFNANSAHPYENPTPLSNFVQILSIFLIPAAVCIAFGKMVGDIRQGWAILAAMTIIFVVMAFLANTAEMQGNPVLNGMGIDQTPKISVSHYAQAGGNMEGKETRFGIVASSIFATVTTAASCGAVNSMHDSFTALGGMVPLWMIQLGEVVFGGVGSGLYGMLIFAMLAVFIAGLMIGRTPEYLGKKIEAFDMKMVSIAILVGPKLALLGTAAAVLVVDGKAGILNPGAHGFTEVLYAFSSAVNNNGSAFAGISSNTPFYNIMLAVAMWFGRFLVIVPVLAIAGSLARKKRLATTVGSLPTHGPLFVALLIGCVVIVGALTYIPALALGPVIEHLTFNVAH